MKKKIYIDAGHNNNGFDTGAAANNMREQDITFDVASLLRDMLNNTYGIKLSRPTITTNVGTNMNSSINSRWQDANSWGADYFVSIHVNAGGGTGVETFISATKQADRAFAQPVNDVYASEMGLRNRGVKLDTESAVRSLGVLRNSRMPAILVELAFIDSPAANPDVNILRNRRRDMAQALAKGLLQFLGVKQDSTPAQSPAVSQPSARETPEMMALAINNVQNMLNNINRNKDNETLDSMKKHFNWLMSRDFNVNR